jgi:hypothetical protein
MGKVGGHKKDRVGMNNRMVASLETNYDRIQ